jgi:hypothetical protein
MNKLKMPGETENIRYVHYLLIMFATRAIGNGKTTALMGKPVFIFHHINLLILGLFNNISSTEHIIT